MQNSKLNVLIYPMLSVGNTNADSNYIIIKQLCNELVKTGGYNFFLILDENRPYVKDDLNNAVKIIWEKTWNTVLIKIKLWATGFI